MRIRLAKFTKLGAKRLFEAGVKAGSADWQRIQNATRYTALAQDRFKGFWRD
jgi:hypothetical protein